MVDCAKYDARYSRAFGPVAQSSQTTHAGPDADNAHRHDEDEGSADAQSAIGTAPGNPAQAPGARSSECAGQYLLATAGVLKT